MKSLFIISLLAVMLVQTFSRMILVIDYQANKEYIMEFLCINREKPELQCEGKCYLNTKLQEQEQSEKQAEKQLQEISINLFCQDLFALDTPSALPSQTLHAVYHPGHAHQVALAVFHPPQLSV